jgi:urease accessory protein UreE
MDNFNLQGYIASGKLHNNSKTLTEAKKQGYDDREDESLGARKGAEKDKKQSMKDRRDDSYGKFGKRDAEKKGKNKINKEEIEVKEDARTDAEEEGYKDGIKDEKEDAKKMKVSELKAKIKEQILSTLTEADEDIDVDIDVEDEVEVEAGADDIEIERPGVTTTVDVGLSPEEEVVQDSLTAAMKAAQELGNTKLADQIGNTITFFTREFVVGQNTD